MEFLQNVIVLADNISTLKNLSVLSIVLLAVLLVLVVVILVVMLVKLSNNNKNSSKPSSLFLNTNETSKATNASILAKSKQNRRIVLK